MPSLAEIITTSNQMADSKVNKNIEDTVDYSLAPMTLKSDKKLWEIQR